MKKSILLIAFALTFISCATLTKQESAQPKGEFNNQFKTTLTTIDTISNNIEGVIEQKNKLKRLEEMYSDKWLPTYYVVLWDIRLSMMVNDFSKKESLLKEAKDELTKLQAKTNINKSEVATLQGYYYYAKIAENPQKNGMVYYKDVIGSYQKAKALDKTNPRPALLLTIFQKIMSRFTGNKYTNFCKDLSNVEYLFTNFTPTNKLSPNWGYDQLKQYKIKFCN